LGLSRRGCPTASYAFVSVVCFVFPFRRPNVYSRTFPRKKAIKTAFELPVTSAAARLAAAAAAGAVNPADAAAAAAARDAARDAHAAAFGARQRVRSRSPSPPFFLVVENTKNKTY
jgi:hypothetical protein